MSIYDERETHKRAHTRRAAFRHEDSRGKEIRNALNAFVFRTRGKSVMCRRFVVLR